MQTFAIIKALLPIVRDIVKAASPNSDGGKKVTREEIEDIVVGHLDDIVAVVLKATKR